MPSKKKAQPQHHKPASHHKPETHKMDEKKSAKPAPADKDKTPDPKADEKPFHPEEPLKYGEVVPEKSSGVTPEEKAKEEAAEAPPS